jgi:chemotaxis protein CheX
MNLNLQDFIVNSIDQSTSQVFSTMLGVEVARGAFTLETSAPGSNDGVVSFIGVAGSWAGSGSLSCSPFLACRICSQMLLTETSSVNEEVLDAVAELTNMIIGSVKTDLEAKLGPLGLSIPTVVYGRNFKTKSAGHAEWIVVRFHWDAEELEVKLCLAPHEKNAHPFSHTESQACALEV